MIELKRIFKGKDYTIGKMYVNGKYFCDTLEDAVRDTKIAGITAIPAGRYQIENSMSPRFKRRLPMLYNVPYFTGVRIHRGNTHEDTEGCILVGENKKKGMVINSTKYELKLVELLDQMSGKIYITIS